MHILFWTVYIESSGTHPESWHVSGSSYIHSISPLGLSCRAPITPTGFLAIISYLSKRHRNPFMFVKQSWWSFHTFQKDIVILLCLSNRAGDYFKPAKQRMIILHMSNGFSAHFIPVKQAYWSFYICQMDSVIISYPSNRHCIHFTFVAWIQ